jgi:hypothetical protein
MIACAGALALGGTGCAGLTKGVETARGTVLGAIDTVRVTVDKGFTVISNGAGAAEKIVGAAIPGAAATVTPVTTSQ